METGSEMGRELDATAIVVDDDGNDEDGKEGEYDDDGKEGEYDDDDDDDDDEGKEGEYDKEAGGRDQSIGGLPARRKN